MLGGAAAGYPRPAQPWSPVLIVKLYGRGGKSFTGLGRYLAHDPGAETAFRVAWTHTLNCANDHVPSAIHEMIGTWRDAELLKQEAGIRRGGRALEKPVKHLSLNWHPSERPDRAAMIEAAENYLAHMGWQDHQAVLVCHTDKAHLHVHVMLSAVHPETGRKLDDGLERRHSQAWALAHEQRQGRIRCPQRLALVAERKPAPPRPAWLAMRGVERKQWRFDGQARRAEWARVPAMRGHPQYRAWRVLKGQQRAARMAFFAAGRQAADAQRREIGKTVREEFRPEWAAYYAARRTGSDGRMLRQVKAGLVARQHAALKERCGAAGVELRNGRTEAYATLLAAQRAAWATLTLRQAAGEVTRPGADGKSRRGIHQTACPIPATSRRMKDTQNPDCLQPQCGERPRAARPGAEWWVQTVTIAGRVERPSRAPPKTWKAKQRGPTAAYSAERSALAAFYAAKINAARLTMPRAQLAAAVAALRAEERAAIDAHRRAHVAREQVQRAAVAMMTGCGPARPSRPPAPSRTIHTRHFRN